MTMLILLSLISFSLIAPCSLMSLSSVALLPLFLLVTPFWSKGYSLYINFFLQLESLGWALMILSYVLVFLMLKSVPSMGPLFSAVHMFILLILWGSFTIKKLILFYIIFEMNLIPISLMIMGWGYQPERVKAFWYMFMYTVGASMPLLVSLVYFQVKKLWHFFFQLSLMSVSKEGTWLSVGLLLAFLVKFPLYGLHLWLPKAHVEAPVGGSMILAGLMLKLGGFGMVLLSPMIPPLDQLASFSLAGGALVALICVRQVDMKILIAYSSVSHLCVAISALALKTTLMKLGSVIILISHGLSSPGMFLGAHLMYLRSNTRSILLNSSMVNQVPIFSMWWFSISLASMATPPFLNLLGELVSILALVISDPAFMLELGLLTMLSGAYSLLLYASTQQGQKCQTKKVDISGQEALSMLSPLLLLLILSPAVSIFC